MNGNSILGIGFDDLSQSEIEERLSNCLLGDDACTIVTPNPEMIMAAQKDAAFASILSKSDIRAADAIGVMYASAALHDEPIQNRNTGVDLFWLLAELCAKHKKRLLLVGGRTGVAEHAALRLRNKYPGLDVRGVNPGIVRMKQGKIEVEKTVIQEIQRAKADVIGVALGHKKQELFIETYKSVFDSVRVFIGFGGAIDMVSGQFRRAPFWMRRTGLEWLWRVWIEPRRLPRIITASVLFPIRIAFEAYKQKRFFRACRAVFGRVRKTLLKKS